ncbi:cbb3-type cytochrome c oxidase subunit I [Selenihalanaerobacter shriftii]|uniref:Nitric oxide reductase subunit B n=1 Tax=Selenihalanaerobacter shriftii TaxID=142842 RepID=A0A1T4LBU8_9FIRM|nr:cbb3-type cytochrome c oxidase subunit I [Selenihalanaerobacter shriftii]SJZ52160.1 nitric oxide reductase subunit B [Selenihalanaerobacter shriftii]
MKRLLNTFKRLIPFLPSENNNKQDDQENKKSKIKTIEYKSQKVSFKFLTAAILMFTFQVFLAFGASMEFIIPDLPAPIPFNAGRAFHINLSIFWPILGIIGGVYYILPEEVGYDINIKLANIQFWLMIITLLSIYSSLSLGFTTGREYLEALLPFKIAIAVSLILFFINILLTLLKRKVTEWHPTMVGLIVGLFFSIIMFIPSMLTYKNIAMDEFFKFWTVHIWVESTLELIIASIISSILLMMTGVKRKTVERWYYVEVFLVILTGFLGVGHHYFWIGTPNIWLYIGMIFGALQILPIFFLVYTAFKSIKRQNMITTNELTFKYLWATVFWNLIGAGGLGFIMTWPGINQYTHGTELVSAHGHLAIFGTYGLLTLSLFYFILPQWKRTKDLSIKKGKIAFWLINSGLALMGISLFIAGVVQSYLLRYVGIEFTKVRALLIPYMIGRSLGGLIFAAGAVIIGWNLGSNLLFKK